MRAFAEGAGMSSQPQGKSAAEVTSLSEDSLKRHYPHLIKRLSPRRLGMALGDALAIGGNNEPLGLDPVELHKIIPLGPRRRRRLSR
jgi:hypothetical protein